MPEQVDPADRSAPTAEAGVTGPTDGEGVVAPFGPSPSVRAPAPSPTPAATFTGAAVRLGRRMVWRDVDLEVGPGEFVAVLGPNGAGKSTLIKAMLGIVSLAEGRVSVLGRPPGRAGRQIGYLPQRRSFDPDVRIRGVDLVRLGIDGHRWGLPLPGGSAFTASGRERRRRVDEAIDLVGATDYARRPIGQMSGGEQQRLLIAQALVHRPRMLLLDEPLDSLDLPNQAVVASMLSGIGRELGITVLIVAHDVNPIAPYLDGVVYVAGGRAVAGPPDEVITSETLTALYGTPIEVLRASDGQMVVVGSPEAPAYHSDRHAGHAHDDHIGHDHRGHGRR